MRDPRSADLVPNLHWRKSSYSNQDGGNCVEVADGHPTHTPVRDSKSPATGTLLFPAPAWQAFLTTLRRQTV
ncbi:DUF397 domain-containing protein [Streptomyces sp. RKND-216]|uniref:DUF397 domain-containing protein n=1 Tax=Streptomyces sp. RKND-216 TaxID=2562581 RepID=UPI001FFC04AC|nr:DUF397 domain-containing protein [Streptomyces sp. RKND-216]